MSLTTQTERQQQISQICLRLLARREHSQQELLDKLALRGYSRQEVAPIVAEMAACNWQDDQRYAESYVRQRLASGYGPLRIRYELQQRGIPTFDLDAEAAKHVGGWHNQLLMLYQHKYPQSNVLMQAEWLKRQRFLLQRGFSAEMIKVLQRELNIKFAR